MSVIDLESLQDAPEGTVCPVDGLPGWFDVRGRRAWYRVSLGDEKHLPRCSCPDHRWRRLGTKIPCKHILLVEEFVEAMRRPRTCPCCGQEWPK